MYPVPTQKKSSLTELLEKQGAVVHYGQRRENITNDIDLIVYTAAIHKDNPEFAAMEELGLPSLTRAQLLGQMMRNYKTPHRRERHPRQNHHHLHDNRNTAGGRY